MRNQNYWESRLGMEKHPEGGYYKAVYSSPIEVSSGNIKCSFQGSRPLSTSIYFMITGDSFSGFHSLKSDEIWYYHDGKSLEITIINEDGIVVVKKLGLDIDKGELPQVIVPAGSIFSAHIPEATGFSLVGCMVSFGFNFNDFKLYSKDELLKKFPNHRSLIEKLTTE